MKGKVVFQQLAKMGRLDSGEKGNSIERFSVDKRRNKGFHVEHACTYVPRETSSYPSL
jgi:hypothetical protein